MASLTPGILSKLLRNIDNSAVKVTGEHRSPLLQVIGIVPSLSGADDLYHNKGFYLRVSDSLHSAYVSVSEDEVDLVLSDKIQLGQFIHVSRIQSGSPVPVIVGLKPVPKRRECVGDPKDLISSDLLMIGVGKKSGKRESVKQKVNVRRVSLGNVKNEVLEPRRLSLDSNRRGWDRSPAAKSGGGRPGSSDSASVLSSRRASSETNFTMKHPIRSVSPLKQVVPNRKSFSDKDLMLRPPSPRISPLNQVLPSRKSMSEKDLTLKPPSPRISPLKHGLLNKKAAPERDSALKHTSSTTLQLKRVKELTEKESTVKHSNLNISPLKNKNAIDSPRLVSKPIRKELKLPTGGTIPDHLSKVPLSFKTWSDAKISWGSLPSSVHDLGKEVMFQRNARFLAAVHALQETSATEGVLQCMRMFSELCESSDTDPSSPLVEEFLNLHQCMKRATNVINALLNVRFPEENGTCYGVQCSLYETCKNFTDKNALSWVQAAVETNLSNFSLFTKEDKRGNTNSERCHYVVLENTLIKVQAENHSPDKKPSPRNQGSVVSGSSSKTSPYNSRQRLSTTKKTSAEEVWSKGNGLTVAASLAEKLLSASQAWFLNYLDASLKKGFGLQKGERDSEIACLLGQLKRVNQWLDDSFTDGSGTSERIEGLKKKLYRFLLDNVDSAAMQTSS